MQFGFVLPRTPPITAIGQKLMVVLACVMNGVKQILKIIKRYAVQLVLRILDRDYCNAEPERKEYNQFLIGDMVLISCKNLK